MGRCLLFLYVVAACCIQWGCNGASEEKPVKATVVAESDSVKVYMFKDKGVSIYFTNKGGVSVKY